MRAGYNFSENIGIDWKYIFLCFRAKYKWANLVTRCII